MLYNGKILCLPSTLEEGIMSNSQGCLLYKKSLKGGPEQRTVSTLLPRCAEVQDNQDTQ